MGSFSGKEKVKQVFESVNLVAESVKFGEMGERTRGKEGFGGFIV